MLKNWHSIHCPLCPSTLCLYTRHENIKLAAFYSSFDPFNRNSFRGFWMLGLFHSLTIFFIINFILVLLNRRYCTNLLFLRRKKTFCFPYQTIEQKGMTFDHDFFSPFLFSYKKKGAKKRGMNQQKSWSKVMPFCLIYQNESLSRIKVFLSLRMRFLNSLSLMIEKMTLPISFIFKPNQILTLTFFPFFTPKFLNYDRIYHFLTKIKSLIMCAKYNTIMCQYSFLFQSSTFKSISIDFNWIQYYLMK